MNNYPEFYTLRESKEFQKTYETASWYKTVKIEAGDYKIKYTDISGRECPPDKSYYGIVVMTGIVTASFFESRLFTSSKNHINEHVNESETIVLQIYSYSLKGYNIFPVVQW